VAPKGQDTISPPQVDHTTAVRLLTAQVETAQRLLKARPLTDDNHARWELNTRHHLVKAFGRGSPMILKVVDAGLRSTCPLDADRKWWEEYRVERLTAQLAELLDALRHLGADLKIPIPRLPAREIQTRTPRPEPRNPPPKNAAPKTQPKPPEAPAPRELAPVDTETHSETLPSPAEIPSGIEVFAGWATESAPPAPASPPRAASPAPSMDHFTGVACLNGHAVTGAAEAYPSRATPRCKTCGSTTLRACRECGVGLRGGQYSMRLDDRAEPAWEVPNYCHSCGSAFPWTRIKRDAIEATISELQELDAAEREGLIALVPDTIAETPKTAVAVMRWQRALSKLSPQTRSLIGDVLKQAAASLVAAHLGLES
jgi:hypothetical protein